MHDARTLAAVAGLAAPPLCEWMAAPLARPGQPLGCFARGNLLRPDFAFDADLPGKWIFAWSGTLAESAGDVSPLNWMRGPALLDEACESLGPQLARHQRRLLLVPHARHVLSDARSALTWWCRHVNSGQELFASTRPPEGERVFGLALDPVALLEPSMVGDAPDHLRTLLAALGPRADAVILRGARPSEDGERMEACALHEGVASLELLRALVEEHAADVPILVPGAAVARFQEACAATR